MNLIQQRQYYRVDGIFSAVFEDAALKTQRFVTLEHSYPHADGSFNPIVQPGVYTCVRGLHRLHGMDHDFETFEITGIKGHKGILFHWGNWNDDSDGCSLCGASYTLAANPRHGMNREKMVTKSRDTFAMFMEMQKGVSTFMLTVLP